ncbi:MAG: hypothetical protein HY788_06840 [Deltaproteobacteria bacterium]|nr:hypothetical protein [Deltaproteobacteria bacterium]
MSERIRELENRLVIANAQLEAIREILDGAEPDDFMMSFPIVRDVWDLKQRRGE